MKKKSFCNKVLEELNAENLDLKAYGELSSSQSEGDFACYQHSSFIRLFFFPQCFNFLTIDKKTRSFLFTLMIKCTISCFT